MCVEDVRSLLSEVGARVVSDPENGLVESRPLFEEMIRSDLHVSAMNAMLIRHLSDGIREDIFTSGKFLVLESIGEIELSVIRYSGTSPYIFSSPNSYMQSSLNEGSFSCDHYRGPIRLSEAIFDPSIEIDLISSTRIEDSAIIAKGFDDIVDLYDFSSAPTAFVRLAQQPQGDYEWAFARGTLRAHSYCTVRLAESNLCGLFELLAENADERCVPAVSPFCEHPLHFVRWKAIQTIGRHDPIKGLSLTRRALDDPHPHVRAAAEATLAAQ